MLECLRIVTPCFKLTDCQSSTLRWMFRFCAGIAAAAALVPAYAAGLAGGSSAVLGQTLDFPVQVRLEADELLTPECLAAEVTLGDRRLPAGLVRTRSNPPPESSTPTRAMLCTASSGHSSRVKCQQTVECPSSCKSAAGIGRGSMNFFVQ